MESLKLCFFINSATHSCPAGLFYHCLFSKRLCHKPLSTEQAKAGSQHMPSADVTRNSLQPLRNCFISHCFTATLKHEGVHLQAKHVVCFIICPKKEKVQINPLNCAHDPESTVPSLTGRPTTHLSFSLFKEKKKWFGLMFFLLELSVAYFCFFKFLMAIECGRELLDCASCQLLK